MHWRDDNDVHSVFSARAFSGLVFQTLNWKMNYRYQCRGICRGQGNAKFLIFELDESRILTGKNQYIYGMFYRFGLIDMPDKVNGKMKRAGRQMWHSKDGWRLLLLTVSYRTNTSLLPPCPSKTRPVKFQSKNRRESAGRTTNNLLHSHLVSAHPHKIHPDITPQSRKITDWGEYLGRADAPAEAPGPQALRRLINENIHYYAHKYTDKKNRENLKTTLKRGIIVVRTSRVWYDNCALWYCNCCFKIRNDYKKVCEKLA